MKKLLTICAFITILLSSCEKEEGGSGNYGLVFNSTRTTRTVVSIYLDGDIKSTTFFVQPQQSYSSTLPCDDKVYAASRDNIFIMTNVSAGKHKVKIEDYSSKKVLWEYEFTLKADQCGSQPFEFN